MFLNVRLSRLVGWNWIVIFSVTMFVLVGCGNSARDIPRGSEETPAIVEQPVGQIVPIGRVATLVAVASGTEPLTYQWKLNGSAIPGANGASYTTPVFDLTNSSQASYQVTVSNSYGTVSSAPAVLTVGPRAPAIGDLRYLLWQQVATSLQGSGEGVELGFQNQLVTNALGAPLEIGSESVSHSGCEWSSGVLLLPPTMSGLNASYQALPLQTMSYSAALASLGNSSSVINSIDLEVPCSLLGTATIISTAETSFDFRQDIVSITSLQSTVETLGLESRVVTAVTIDPNTNDAILVSYGWQDDTTTLYDALTSVVAPANVMGEISTLATQGYFVSAFGGNDTTGYIIVGMRVHGDTLPRIVGDGSPYSGADPVPFTPVAWLSEPSGTQTIYEK